MATATQQQKVLEHLRQSGAITPCEEIMRFHATRLSGILQENCQ